MSEWADLSDSELRARLMQRAPRLAATRPDLPLLTIYTVERLVARRDRVGAARLIGRLLRA